MIANDLQCSSNSFHRFTFLGVVFECCMRTLQLELINYFGLLLLLLVLFVGFRCCSKRKQSSQINLSQRQV